MTETDAQANGAGPSYVPIYAVMFGCMAAMMGFVAQAGSLAQIFELAPWQIGLTVTMSGLVWVLTSTFWGQYSDRVGRKPVIMAGAALFLGAYLLLVFAVFVSFWAAATGTVVLLALMVTRGAIGLGFAAMLTASNSFIADTTPPAERAGEMGRLGAFQAMGMIAGPALVALLAWTGVMTTLLLLAVLPVITIVLLAMGLRETRAVDTTRRPPLSVFDPRLRVLCLMGAGALFCVGLAQVTVSFVVLDRFGIGAEQGAQYAGLALTMVGLAMIPSQLSVKWTGLRPLILIAIGAMVGGLGLVLAAVAAQVWVLIAGYGALGFGMAWVFSGVAAQAANSVSADEQGRAAGAVSASQGVGVMVGPLAGTLIYPLGTSAPYLVACAILSVIILLAWTMVARTAGLGASTS